MADEAEQFAEADKAKRESIEVKNEAEAAVHNTSKQLEEFKDSLPEVSRGITAAIPMENPYCSCKLTRVRSERMWRMRSRRRSRSSRS